MHDRSVTEIQTVAMPWIDHFFTESSEMFNLIPPLRALAYVNFCSSRIYTTLMARMIGKHFGVVVEPRDYFWYFMGEIIRIALYMGTMLINL
jgi:hypothetical protein